MKEVEAGSGCSIVRPATGAKADAAPVPPLPEQDLEHTFLKTGNLWELIRGQSLFLTGGTGFVGTWLVESFVFANDRLHLNAGLTLLTRDTARFQARFPHITTNPSIRLLQGDVRAFPFPEGDFRYVIHAATGDHSGLCGQSPLAAFDEDVNGTRHVLDFACSHGARRFLLTSSGAVYGRQPSGMTHIPEDYPGAPAATDPASGYGHAKRISEHACAMYGRSFGFDALIARLFAFAGPLLPLDLNFAVGNFIRDAIAGVPIHVAGDGTPYRSYLYAADLAVWLWTILLCGKPSYPYNVGSAHALTIAELAGRVVRIVAPGLPVEIAGSAVPGVPPARYVPDTGRAERELGLQAWIPLDEGIRRMAAWYSGNPAGGSS